MKYLLLVYLISCYSLGSDFTKIESRLKQYATSVSQGKEEGVTSFLVYKNNLRLFEHYAPNYNANDTHDLRSVTKSLTAILVGIAIEQGLFPKTTENITPYINNIAANNTHLKQITFSDLLTMRTGLACDDWVPASLGNEDKMYLSANWAKFFIDLPFSHTPGKHFSYCTGGAVLVGHLLNQTLNNDFESWSKQYLFSKLNISNYKWSKTPYGVVDTGGHIFMTPRDLAKIGQLILNNGKYNEQQILPSYWLDKMTSSHTKVYERPYEYGYWWWLLPPKKTLNNITKKAELIFAWGNGGQYLFISPKHQLIFVFTGTNYNSRKMLLPQLKVKKWLSLIH